MKKLFVFAAVALFCSAMNAQIVTATSYTKAKKDIRWYVKAGLNFSEFSGDMFEDGITGYNIGIGFDSPIGESGLFWSSGLSLATKGGKTSWREDDDEYGEVKLNSNKLEIPLTIGYRYKIDQDWAVDIRFGGFVNYDLWGKLKYEEVDGNYTDSEEYDLGEIEEFFEYDADYTRLGAGLLIGVGGWWQKLNFSITYEIGLINQFDSDYYDAKMKERNLMISVAYAF